MIAEILTWGFALSTATYLTARERHNRRTLTNLTERVQEINDYIQKQEEEKNRADLSDYWWNKNDHWVDQKDNKLPTSDTELKNLLNDKQYTIYEKYVKSNIDRKRKVEKEEGEGTNHVRLDLSPAAKKAYKL